jgi:2-polyprenyl-3-methyl-5-hydroxy-6-metoxy-1,4-benzoquinol methylase
MIDIQYRDTYRRIFEELLEGAERGELDESGLPSYTHRNPLMSWLFWRRIQCAFAMFENDSRHRRVLDFGCGMGVSFMFLKEKGFEITACDREFAQGARMVAKKLGATVRVLSDIRDLGDEKFDWILALDVLEHVDDLAYVLECFRNLADDNAKTIVSGPTENVFYKLGRLMAGFSGHYHKRSVYDVEEAMKKSNFVLEQMETLIPPMPLFRISRWRLHLA